MNLNIPAPILGAFQIGPKIKNGHFLKNGSNSFD
jgi:hypothetical protein